MTGWVLGKSPSDRSAGSLKALFTVKTTVKVAIAEEAPLLSTSPIPLSPV